SPRACWSGSGCCPRRTLRSADRPRARPRPGRPRSGTCAASTAPTRCARDRSPTRIVRPSRHHSSLSMYTPGRWPASPNCIVRLGECCARVPFLAMTTALAFRSVTKRFPDGTLGLADATWYVAEGAHACLLGPSGSGKTTAVRLLQAALKPTGGSVLLLGVPVDGPAFRQARSRLGIVPQLPGMAPDLTAGEDMTLAARLHGAPGPPGRAT